MGKLFNKRLYSSRVAYFANEKKLVLVPDSWVIVAVERGFDIARVISSSIFRDELEELYQSGKILRIIKEADEEDNKKLEHVKFDEAKGSEKFQELVGKYPFEMKLVSTIYQFDGNKLTFFFTADGRVDFREFVRELASYFRTRIELHQTTGRDEAKRIGGIGMCGYSYCCASFLKRFNQVTIKMAKDQNLSGNLSKISGPCSRLLCCLHYEEDYYIESQKEFPEIGTQLRLNGEQMYVFKVDCYNKKIHLTGESQEILVMNLDEYNKKFSKTSSCQRCRRS